MSGIAKRVKKRSIRAGVGQSTLEGHLSGAAFVNLVLGILGSAIVFVAYANSQPASPAQSFSHFLWTSLYAAMFLWGGYLLFLFFRWLADILQIQKEVSGHKVVDDLPGQSRTESVYYACGNCNARLHSDSHCEVCGYKIAG